MEKPSQLHPQQQQQIILNLIPNQTQPQIHSPPQPSPLQVQPQQQQQQQPQIQATPHILFELTPLDPRDELDEKTQRTYNLFKQMISGKTIKECHELYSKFTATSATTSSDTSSPPSSSTTQSQPPHQNVEDLTMGILVAILVETDGHIQSKYYRDVVNFSKDGLNLFSAYLNMIVIERLYKLKEHSIRQVLWITNQLMEANINSAENISFSLLRQLAGGDLSPKNLWLTEAVLDLLIENRNWLVSSTTFMVAPTIYTFMRLIADHLPPIYASLRQKEVEFVIGLVREQFSDSLLIGRDFLRLLNMINKIPEFESLWHDIFNNPKSLHPSFQSPLQLLSTRTPRRLIQSRLTFDMERKISFLATQVKFGNQKRYQDAFHKQYLSTPESLSLRCDLIRYICSLIHPSNEVLCSDIIPRWAIIGWLLATCTSNLSASNSKIALFYDWLVYDPKVDNIMNIEPGILVMYYSLRSHPNVTAGLLDFLCRLPVIFLPKLSEHLKVGIKKSLQQILEKRVIQSLAPLFDNPKHDPSLKALIKETFPEFCANSTQAPSIDNGISSQSVNSPTPTNQQQSMTQISAGNLSKQPDIILIDHDISSKPNSSTEPLNSNQEAVVGNRPTPAQENNHVSPRIGEQPSQHGEDKIESNASSLVTQRDEQRSGSWNGLDTPNPTHLHKPTNHDIKSRKTPQTNASASCDTKKVDKRPVGQSDEHHDIGALSRLQNPSDQTNQERFREADSNVKVIYPFMIVQDLDFKETINSFDEQFRNILEDLSVERCNDTKCSLMDKLISVVFENNEMSTNPNLLRELGHCLAYLLAGDFSTRIFPSLSSHDITSLEQSLAMPLFVLFRNALLSGQSNCILRPMALLVHVSRFLEATGFLVLYFLRVNAIVNGTGVSSLYIDFCNSAKRKLNKCLYDDLFMALTYDSEMFCFLLPSIFGEFANCGSFSITGNIDLIRLVVSTVDPIYLQELICLCLTGTAKVINKEDVLPLIESSLGWESWEQYCVWKLICAQSVPIENYISILPKLDTRANSEAMSCILLNLQKVTEPTVNMLQILINCECKPHDPFISSILRYWSMKTDVKDLARMITSLVDSRPASPPAKRKGQMKAASKSTTQVLTLRSEKILRHLESIRQRAPKNKLLAQPEIIDMISQLESLCNDAQKRLFADLFLNRPKTLKKQKRIEKEVGT